MMTLEYIPLLPDLIYGFIVRDMLYKETKGGQPQSEWSDMQRQSVLIRFEALRRLWMQKK
jgi:hypothetical protein